MKNTSSLLLASLTSLWAITLVASDLVTNVTIRQVRPWQGMVEVRYELTEDLSTAACSTTVVTFTDREHDTNYAAKTFTHPFTYTKGVKRMIWNATKDGVSFKSSNVVCTVSVTSGDVPADEGLYCIVDLSGGTSASSYPVTYLASVPAGGWTDEYKTTKLVLRKIKPGTFTMGSPEDELGRGDNETRHQVTLTKGFYIGVFEVTQRQWELVMGNRPSYFNNDTCYASRPVEQVSYNTIRGSSFGTNWPASNAVDTDSFLGKIRAKTGLVFDLPTEAQWEYACRAGTSTTLNSGKNLTSTGEDANMAEVGRYWYNGGSLYSSSCDTSAGSVKVGSYAPNDWGLYDMHGNVYEFCLDWWQSDLGTDAMTDPVGTASGDYRLLRGGCWHGSAHYCRSANREYLYPSNEYYGGGFRLSCPVTSGGTPAAEGLYCIVDLSGGTTTASYPVTYIASIPSGGWTDEYKTNKLVLRKIEPGTFTMGSPSDEVGRGAVQPVRDETQHQVTLTKSFYLGVFEVTQRQWELVMGNRPSYFTNDTYYATRPVEQVSHTTIRGWPAVANWPESNAVDADSFLGKIRAKTGLVFDLPTEAQWEYACRAGTTTALNSGKNLTSTDEDANMAEVGRYMYNGGENNDRDVSTDGGTAKVGSYVPNAWGLYDMHGNEREWCLDWYSSDSHTASVSDPVGAKSGDARILRGGNWCASASSCRSAHRSILNPSVGNCGGGFRLACSAESSK